MKNMLPKLVKAMFLDFDGVVVESADIKTQAFFSLYQPHGQQVAEQAKQYHLAHQGVSRYEKFDAIHRQYLDRMCPPDEAKKLSALFSQRVFQQITESPLVPGVFEFLQKMKKEGVPVALLSATPHEELREIVAIKGLAPYFSYVIGSPTSKVAAGNRIMQELNLEPNKIVFIGDSISDLTAAEALEVHFIGRACLKHNHSFGDKPVIQDFTELL
jgi:HAD superfamily hydrolase (TIGR01509 family)